MCEAKLVSKTLRLLMNWLDRTLFTIALLDGKLLNKS
jgi:hypothetical protein